MKNTLVVTNFNAGRKQAVKYKKKVLEFLLKRCKLFKFSSIEELDSIDTDSFDTIITMGGDGTVNKVLPYLINTNKTLGIIPTGTANLLASNLGISSNIKNALEIIEKDNIKQIDVIKINDNLSALRMGIGYDFDIISKTPQSLKNKFGYFSYFIAGIIFALRLKKKEYEIIADNNKFEVNASCIIISNASNMYKNIVSIGIDSCVDDGLIDIFILKTSNPILFFFEFLKIIFNLKHSSSKVQFLKAKNINIKNTWIACHIDGEKKKIKDDIYISIEQKSVNVFCR